MTRIALTLPLIFAAAAHLASAADWTTYRGNAARTAQVEQSLSPRLSKLWTFQAAEPPQPAWPRSSRMPMDRAYHVVANRESIFFGSSSDGAVRALDAQTGQVRWIFYTDAPIRFAPVLWRDRLLVASDDGHLYALATKDGSLLWKKRGGPDDRSILGNTRMISKWPARGGPAVVDDVVYFAAGIWPSDGIFLYALDPQTGREIWRNDDSGAIYMAQPHGGANAKSGVSAQGYLVVSGDRLFVPTGRAVPAAFDRQTGKFQYFHLQKYGHNGGAPTMAVGDMFFNSGLGFNADSGEKLATLGSGELAATKDGLVRAGGGTVGMYRWAEVEQPDRKGNLVKTRVLKPLWSVKEAATGASLVAAGETIITGGAGRVDMIDTTAQTIAWSSEVDGVAYGLAVADGRLLVSTDRGAIVCFGNESADSPATEANLPEAPYGENDAYARAAEEIIRRTKQTEGYCLDYGCGDGALTYELARRTGLKIVAVDDDPRQVALARKKLTAAGVYGSRVVVQHRPLTATGYPRYFANLIVSRRALNGGGELPSQEIARLQRPYGGAVCLGPADAMKVAVREKLAGAGSWTHQYGDAANTVNSGDSLVSGKLTMHWFRDFDFDVPQRHGRAPAPLFNSGRLFHEGINGIVAVDAYNGRELWRYEIKGLLAAYNGDELMGTAGTGSNFCLHGDSVFIRHEHRCLQLDAATGTLKREFTAPPQQDGKPGRWGYIACVDGIVYGSLADPEHVVTYRYRDTTGDMQQLLTESQALFAIDADGGNLLWRYDARDSIRHNAIAIGAGKVCLIDRPLALTDRVKKSTEKKDQALGRLLVLNAKTGKPIWDESEDIYGTTLALSAPHQALVMSYQPTRFRLDSEVGGRISVFALDDGKRLWQVEARYDSRPTINDRTVYAQGGAWDLLTGESRPFNFTRSYGCGILAGSKNMMLFRSATLGYFDVVKNKAIENYGGLRPGCWINAIPAGGLVLVPDATAGCECSYLNKAWIALEPEG